MLQRDLGFEVVQAENGEEAWQILQRNADICMVISDWMMPQCDGLELTQRIRSSQIGRYTYVILLTSKNEHTDLLAGMSAGADEYLTKPFDPLELKLRMRAGQRILQLEDAMRSQNMELEAAYNALAEGVTAAMRVQNNLLPLRVDLQGLEQRYGLHLEYQYKACQNLGGDLVGVVDLHNGKLAVFLADVSGHGLAASIAAVSLHAHIRSNAELLADPLEFLADANVFCCHQLPDEVYATLVLLLIDTATEAVQLAVAGHPPLMKLAQGGAIEEFEATMQPLGLFPERPAESAVIETHFRPGDLLFAYTDGVIETRNNDGDFFSTDKLRDVVRKARENQEALSTAVLRELSIWRGPYVPPEDDMTLVTVGRH